MAMAYTTEGGGGASSVKDHYATLGVSPGASMHEIKNAYRRLALQHHPDVCDGDNCTLNFQQINKAYEDWEEWMGWEGAGTRDYSSHINV